jgi:hypothetical protein
MTGRLGAKSIDGTPISRADVARMEAEEALHAQWQRKAVLVVAATAHDAIECRELLAMLGLDSQIVREARDARATSSAASAKAPRRPARRRAKAA